MRFLLALFALILLGFAAVQYNDADNVRWIVGYGGGAVLCAAAALGKARWSLPFGWALGALLWAAMIGRHVVPDRMSFEVEEFRETFGLALMAAMLLAAAWCARSSRGRA
jgi:hypothetical protein